MEFEMLELDDSALDSVIHFPPKLIDFETVEKALCRGNKNGVTCINLEKTKQIGCQLKL